MDIKVDGNEPDLAKDPTGKVMRSEALELWFRDPVEIVEELIGNPQFREVMKYAPERVYADMEGKTQVINEMWTGSWWWEIQVSMRREEAKSSASSPIFVAMLLHGQSISPSETSGRRLGGRDHRMPLFSLVTCPSPSSTASQKRCAHSRNTACSIHAWMS